MQAEKNRLSIEIFNLRLCALFSTPATTTHFACVLLQTDETEKKYNAVTTEQFIGNWFLCGKQPPMQANRNAASS